MQPAVFVPIVLALLALGIFLLLRWLATGGSTLEADLKARLARATPANATVISIEKSANQSKRGSVVLKVRLRLEGADSRDAIGIWEVEKAHLATVQPEKVLKIAIDADEPSRCYPVFAGAEHSRLYETMWSDDEP